MTDHNDVFDAFIRAKAAMDKVPELEAKIECLSGDLSIASEIINLYKQDLSKAHNDRDTALDRLSALEVALEGARKSEADTASRLDLVISTLRDLGGNIGAALSVVTPEPTPEPVAEVVSVPVDPTTTVDPTMKADVTAASPSTTAVNAPSVPDITSDRGPTDFPASNYEANLRDRGEGWFDTNDYFHKGTIAEAFVAKVKEAAEAKAQEAPADATSPFAASTDATSPTAESPAPASWATSAAPPSDAALLPNWVKYPTKSGHGSF